MAHMTYVYTRSGLGPAIIEDRELGFILPIAYYAPKPDWMTHIPGSFLRFANRHDYRRYLSK